MEVALLCNAGKREVVGTGDSKQVHRKPLEAFQPHGALNPADLWNCCRDQQYPIWKGVWGAMLVAQRDPPESRDKILGFEPLRVY